MSLLPADELKKIEDKVERGEMTVDFYDILGEVQKNKPAAQTKFIKENNAQSFPHNTMYLFCKFCK